ncbi:MAG: hypothetical protein GX973_05360 [Firmicutes bacterium]|nr:hypothetical protein [Bacillota bacterium]
MPRSSGICGSSRNKVRYPMTDCGGCDFLKATPGDQTQDKIRIESDAILAILSKCMQGQWHLLSSEVIDIEIGKIPDEWKKIKVYKLYSLAKENVMLNKIIIKRAYELQDFGLKAFDGLHVASAEKRQSGCVFNNG